MGEYAEIKSLITDHIKDSNEFREEMKTSIAEIKVHSKYTQKTLKNNCDTIDELKATQDKQRGGMFVIGLMGLGGIIKAVVDFVKHVGQ